MRLQILFAAALALIASACTAAGTNQSVPSTVTGSDVVTDSHGQVQPAVDTTSILKMLTKRTIIGSTIDPTNGDQNPSGLVYVNSKPFGGGVIGKGDLVFCNFNDSANVPGNGTTVDYISSTPGSQPKTFIQNAKLQGCSSLVINGFDAVYAPDLSAKNVVGMTAKGKLNQTIANSNFVQPWSSAYMTSFGYPPGDGIFVSDASTGKILRVDLGSGRPKPPVTAVISGFAVNKGQPGSLLGPSGVQYDQNRNILYVVDGVTNTIVSVKSAYDNLHQVNSIVVGADGKTFTGPKKSLAHVVYAGKPLNGPITSTLLPNGNLIVANSLGKNTLIEIANNGALLATKVPFPAKSGAIFGMASSGTNDATTKVYFNNRLANNVQVLSK
ncbi:MAG TPA: hypothetical protein VIJ77_04000 [Candidatus Tumulicola sp.]